MKTIEEIKKEMINLKVKKFNLEKEIELININLEELRKKLLEERINEFSSEKINQKGKR